MALLSKDQMFFPDKEAYLVIVQNTFAGPVIEIVIYSSHSIVPKYNEIMLRKPPPIPTILVLIAREGINGTREVKGKIIDKI